MSRPEKINCACICGCGMGSSLLLKILLSGVLEDHGVNDYRIECVDAGSVPEGLNLVLTSSAFEQEMIDRFEGKVPVIAIKNFYGKEELEKKLGDMGWL
jgi:PTS system ascorbate-specific IIB component